MKLFTKRGRHPVGAPLVVGIAVLMVSGLALAYTVRPGDSLWSIAKRTSVSVADLKAKNGLTSDTIYPGTDLEIPTKAKPGTNAPATGTPKTDTSTASAAPDFGALQQQIKEYLTAQPATYKVYFKDLQSGKSFGIGEWDWMVGASSTKVPTVLYLYNLAAKGQIDLNEKVAYQDSDYEGGAGGLQFYVKPGDTFTLQYLAHQAITVSDNIAHRMLLRRLGKDNVAAFMRSLGGQTVYPNGNNITTARDLATYMQAVLDFKDQYPGYGGTLLYDLEHTIWNAGLNGALPSDTTVAHKEGDVIGVSNDVGVVFGKRPYLLAVMSSNQVDSDKGFQYIAQISKMAFEYENGLAPAQP